jgi:hypothetical protein
MKPIACLLYLVVAMLVAFPMNFGMMYHDLQAMWLSSGLRNAEELAAERRSRHRYMALAPAAIASVVWPVGVPTVYVVTGFARNGVFKQAHER